MSVLMEEVNTMADKERKLVDLTEEDPEKVSESDEKVNDAEKKDAEKKVSSKAKEHKEEEEENDSSDEEELSGLYDQPLVVEGKRQRKRTEFLVKDQMEIKKEPQPLVFNGRGESLGSMEVVNHEISRCTALELKPLHKLLFGRDGRTTEIKKNIRVFNGFNFEEGTKEYESKKLMIERFTNEGLKRLLELLDLEKKGTREDLKERVYTFLMKPVASGRTVQPSKKKTKNSRPKSKGGQKRKRVLVKVKKSSEEVDNEKEDEEKEDKEDSEEQEPKKKKAKIESKVSSKPKGSPKKVTSPTKTAKETKTPTKKEKGKPGKKESAKKAKKAESKKTPKKSKPVTVKITAGKRTTKKSPKKVEKPGDDESSSDDEPLAKKIKKHPPTNEDLAKMVTELLKNADLDQVTVKSISKQVFSKYPEFDLSDKKAFIKETVYSVISGDAD